MCLTHKDHGLNVAPDGPGVVGQHEAKLLHHDEPVVVRVVQHDQCLGRGVHNESIV